MMTRLGFTAMAIAAVLMVCCVAGTVAAYSGDAGGGFRYEDFDLTKDRDLTGFIVNTKNTNRRNVRVTITAIGQESGEPLWSTKLNLGNMSSGERKSIHASYGRYTADPGAFTFEFTEDGAPIMEAQEQEADNATVPEDEGEEDSDTPGAMLEKNACSSIEDSLRGKEISGSGECTTVSFELAEGSARFSLMYTPSDPITVQLLNKDGKPLEFLFEQLTYSTGSKRITVAEEGIYAFKVLAAGDWSIRIQQANAPAAKSDEPASPARRFDMDSRDDGSMSISNY